MSSPLQLPITLGDLGPKTREWLLAKSMKMGAPPQEALIDALDQVAGRELRRPLLGSSPTPSPAPEPSEPKADNP